MSNHDHSHHHQANSNNIGLVFFRVNGKKQVFFRLIFNDFPNNQRSA